MTAVAICLLVILALEFLTPFWWWVMIVPFAYGAAAARSAGRALRTGLFAGGLLWLGAAAYWYLTESRIVAGRVAAMFGLGGSWLLVPITGLVGAVAAGVAGASGFAVRALFGRRPPGRT
jgi:hypothetical protein